MLSSNAPKFQGIRSRTISYEQINEIMASYINTIFIGDVLSFDPTTSTAVIDVHNSKPFNSQIVENNSNPSGVPGFWFQPIGQITLRCFCPAFIEATPQVNDTVICFVPQSSIEAYFDGSVSNYGGRYNIGEALVFPIKTGYSTSNTLTINPNYANITNVIVNAENLTINPSEELALAAVTKINTNKFSVTNETGELITILSTVLNAIAAIVPVPGTPLDTTAGGAITLAATELETFIS